jgi:hypothetical protein
MWACPKELAVFVPAGEIVHGSGAAGANPIFKAVGISVFVGVGESDYAGIGESGLKCECLHEVNGEDLRGIELVTSGRLLR